MVGRLRDEGDVDVRALEMLGREQSAEAGPDDDDAMTRGAMLSTLTYGP